MLLERRPVVLAVADLAALEARRPGFRATLGGIELSAITYRSDGLKVRGYLAVPRGAKDLPCIVFNRGGMMTYMALRRTGRVKVAVIGAGLTDAAASIEQRPEMERVFAELVPGWPRGRDAALAARSVLRWPEELPAQTPLLIFHGTADWRVDPTQALDLADALLKLRRPSRLVLFEGGDHGLSEHREESDRLVRDWFDRYLRDGRPWPDTQPHGD